MSDFPKSRTHQVSHLLVGSVALQGANLIVFVLLARWLPVNDFGLYRQLFLIHQLLTGLFFAAIPTSLLYFCGRSSASERAGIVRRHLKIVVVVGLVTSVALVFGGQAAAVLLSNPDIESLLWVFAPYPAAYMLYSLVSPSLIAYGRSLASSMFSLVLAILNSVPVLIAAGTGASLTQIVATATIGALLGAVLALIVILRATRGGVFAGAILSNRQILNYLWPLLAASGIGLLGLRMDQVIVSNMLGPEVYGIYVVGAFEIPLFGMLQSSVSAVLLPQFSQLAKTKAWAEIAILWQRALVRSAVIVYPIAASLFVLADVFIVYIFGEKYNKAVLVFQLYLLLAPVRIMTFGLVLRACGQTKPDLWGAAAYSVSVSIGAVFCVRIFGPPGAMLAVVLCTAGLGYWLAWRTQNATDGVIQAKAMYPFRIFIAFPLIIAVFWLLMKEVLMRLVSLSNLTVLLIGAGLAILSIFLGFYLFCQERKYSVVGSIFRFGKNKGL